MWGWWGVVIQRTGRCDPERVLLTPRRIVDRVGSIGSGMDRQHGCCTYLSGSYIRTMTPRRTTSHRALRVLRERPTNEVLVAPVTRRGRRPRTVAFQWYDGAGELHYEVLSPAQSWPYLN